MYVNLPEILKRKGENILKNPKSLENTQTEKELINQPVKSLFIYFSKVD